MFCIVVSSSALISWPVSGSFTVASGLIVALWVLSTVGVDAGGCPAVAVFASVRGYNCAIGSVLVVWEFSILFFSFCQGALR
jgi:hypothetical protein